MNYHEKQAKILTDEILNNCEDLELNDLKYNINEDEIIETGIYLIDNLDTGFGIKIEAVSELEALRKFISRLGYTIKEVWMSNKEFILAVVLVLVILYIFGSMS